MRVEEQRNFENDKLDNDAFEKREQRQFEKNELKKQIDMTTFKIGLYMFMIPPLIQFLIFFTAYFLPFSKGLELIWNLMPLILLLNLVAWISVPIILYTISQTNQQISSICKRFDLGPLFE